MQVPVPLQPPPVQPTKVCPAEGAAERVTLAPEEKTAVQVAPQSIPGGLLVTIPPPVLLRVRAGVGAGCVTATAGGADCAEQLLAASQAVTV
jgi:hypothetical protein